MNSDWIPWILISEFIYLWIHIWNQNPYIWIDIHEFIYSWIHIFISYMNSEKSYEFIIHETYEFIYEFIYMNLHMNSYNDYKNSYVYEFICIWIHVYEFIYEFMCFMNDEFIWFFQIWIHMFHEFIYEFGCTKIPDESLGGSVWLRRRAGRTWTQPQQRPGPGPRTHPSLSLPLRVRARRLGRHPAWSGPPPGPSRSLVLGRISKAWVGSAYIAYTMHAVYCQCIMILHVSICI